MDEEVELPKKKCADSKLWYGLPVFGFVLVVLGSIAYACFPLILHNKVASMMPLKPGTDVYAQWTKPNVPIYLQFWLFNLTNQMEVINSGDRPSVQQIGPYSYKEEREKVNITFHDNNSTVSYREIRRFTFDPSTSAGSEDDILMTVNILYIVVAEKVKNFPHIVKALIEGAVEFFDKGLFIEKSVKDIIWGYVDPALADVNSVLKKFGMQIETHIGLFYGKNNTDDGAYLVHTGTDNIDLLDRIVTWNNSNQLHSWTTDWANMINGTDGTLFAPFVDKSDTLYLFSSDICRSIYANFEAGESIRGIDTYRFVPPEEVFANTTVNPNNAGFCVPNCLGSGVLNMSTCIPGGAPAIMSQPHFYQADQRYINGVIGMNPSPELRTTINIEPTTGIVLSAAKKLQISMSLEPIDGFSETDKLRNVFMPMMWINESTYVDEGSAAQFRSQLVQPVLIAKMLLFSIIGLGCAIMLVSVAWILIRRRNRFSASNSPYVPVQ